MGRLLPPTASGRAEHFRLKKTQSGPLAALKKGIEVLKEAGAPSWANGEIDSLLHILLPQMTQNAHLQFANFF